MARVPGQGHGEPATGLLMGLKRGAGGARARASGPVGGVLLQRGDGGCNLIWSRGFSSVSR